MSVTSTITRDKLQEIFEGLDQCGSSPETTNRRNAPRVNVRQVLTAIALADSTPAPIQVFSRNFSVSGIGFVSRRMFNKNDRIALHIAVKGLPTRLILARVTFGRYVAAGLHEMGAEFLECIKGNEAIRIPPHWKSHAYTPSMSAKESPKAPDSSPDPC